MHRNTSLPGDPTLVDPAVPKNTFFKLTPEVSKKLIICNLSKSEMKLWLYLVALAPFGDRQYAYSAPQAMLACGLKRAIYFASKAKLQKLGLIDFRDGENKFFNKLAPVDGSNEPKFSAETIVQKTRQFSGETIVQKTGLESKNLDSSPENQTMVQKTGLPKAETISGQEVGCSPDYSDSSIQQDNAVVDFKKCVEEESDHGEEESGVLEQEEDPVIQAEAKVVRAGEEREVFIELRRLGIETNEGVRATMKTQKANVANALAHIKQRYASLEKFGNITGAFVKACQDGAKPYQLTRKQINPPSSTQLAALDEAKVARTIKNYYLAPWGDGSAVLVDTGRCMLPWWEFLGD